MKFWQKHHRFILTALVLGAGLSLLGVGCGGTKTAGPGDVINLVYWKPYTTSDQMKPLIDAFEKSHKNIKITYRTKPFDTYEQELVDSLAAGTGPDIFSIHNDWLPKHFDKIAPFPSDTYGLRDYQNDFVDVAAQDFVLDGKVYAVPLSVDTLALYYNKDILFSAGIAQPPATWQDVIADTKIITKQDTSGNITTSAISLGTSSNINRSVDILQLLMLQNGTQMTDDKHLRATFDQSVQVANNQSAQPGVTALTYYTDFAQPSKEVYTWNNKQSYNIDNFIEGKTAMVLSYQYQNDVIKGRQPNLNYGIAPVPQVDANNKVNYANYWGEAVSANSAHQDAAFEFLKYISSKDVLTQYYAKNAVPSSRKDLVNTQLADPVLGVFATQALTAKSWYKTNSSAIEAVLADMIDDVILRAAAPANAIRDAAQQVTQLMKQ